MLPGTPADGKLQGGDVITRIREPTLSIPDAAAVDDLCRARPSDFRLDSSRWKRAGGYHHATKHRRGSCSAISRWLEAGRSAGLGDQGSKLPEAGNVAAYVAPKPDASTDRLGLLMLLLNPGQGSPLDVLKTWSDAASRPGWWCVPSRRRTLDAGSRRSLKSWPASRRR